MASDRDNKVDGILHEALKKKETNLFQKSEVIKKLNEEKKEKIIVQDGQENSLDEKKKKKTIIKNNEDILKDNINNFKNNNKPQININKSITICDKKNNNKYEIPIIGASKRMDAISSYDEKKDIIINVKENHMDDKKKKKNIIIINKEDIQKDNTNTSVINNHMKYNKLNVNISKDESILSEKGNKTDIISSIFTDTNRKKQVSFFSQVDKNIMQQTKGNMKKKKKNDEQEEEKGKEKEEEKEKEKEEKEKEKEKEEEKEKEKVETYLKEPINKLLYKEQFYTDIYKMEILKKDEIHKKSIEKNNIVVKGKQNINTSSKNYIFIPSQNNVCPPSQNNVCPPSQNNVCPPSQNNVCPSSQNNVCPPLQNNVCPPLQNNVCPPSQNNVCPSSQNKVCPPSQNNVPPKTHVPSKNNKVTKIVKLINEKQQNKSNYRNTKWNNTINKKINGKNYITGGSKMLTKDLKKEKSNTLLSKNNLLDICSPGSDTVKETSLTSDKKKKKKNPYETSLENKLNILNKRVRCLTSFENIKDGLANVRNNQTAGNFKESLLSHDMITKNNNITSSSHIMNNNNNNNTQNSNIMSCDNIHNNNISPEHNSCDYNKNNVLLLLTRDFRINDNWSLIYAYEQAKKKKAHLFACTYLNRKEPFPKRHIDIKLKVLKNLEENMKKILNIPFYVLTIYMIDEFMEFLRIHDIKTIICDFNPLNETRIFIQNLVELSNKKKIKILQVDSHNIVPIWITSKMEESCVRTIKPKIQTHISTFLIEYVQLEMFDQIIKYPEPFSISEVFKKLTVYIPCPVLLNFVCTEQKAHEILQNFCSKKLERYNLKKNDPNSEMINLLTPYINFGIISSQRCVLEVNKYANNYPSINTISGKETFSEEMVMKKELADNFCYYNKNYDNFNGGKDWAKDSLKKHDSDKREYLYDFDDFKNAKTHDDLWNCCQLQLINEGIIHEFLRMYWCKKILNWSGNSKTALKCAMKLNDDFSIDAKSPHGYVSIMSSIMGIHDQSWNERTVFGKIRFMNYNSCKRNFDINVYMSKYPKGKENALIVQKIPTMTFSSYIKKRKNNNITIEEKKNEKREKKCVAS
ncbi:deoxyribodipyrimidine photo-lyase, putative [Plasmodium reichenowi]|uniref:Deoxyribodipyrimidine photo-lyase n=1 Tax=Plasmodium reichenowi TaxID=5854 RepID=A0A060RTX5_PLARE|nr:deoxyribodipyrimidine photo-lyase, putative [Plasmodium reichenowi]